MSLFSNIVDKIFNHGSNANAATQGHFVPTLSGTSIPGQPDLSAKPVAATPSTVAQPVDLESRLSSLAAQKGGKFNYKESIVDLLKLLDLDSSLASRQSLARELKYTGDLNDSAKMNVWLHEQVMSKLEANGGNVPADLNKKLH